MSIETGKARVPLWVIYVAALLLFTAGFAYWLAAIPDEQVKLLSIVSGVVSGLVVSLLTFVALLKPLQDVDRFKVMGVKAVLANRHDRAYYRALVKDAEREVSVMGASCTRFIEDFLDVKSEDKALIDALNTHRALVVRLLIPQEQFMAKPAKQRLQSLATDIRSLQTRFPARFEVRRFDDEARHSFLMVDNNLVAGPIFEKAESKYAPAIHVEMKTVFAQKYSEHFEDVWKTATPFS